MTVNQVISNPATTFHYTKKMLPTSQDSTLKKIAKVALIILSLGSIFIVTFKIDLIMKVVQYFATKNQPKVSAKPQNLKDKIYYFAKKFWFGIQKGSTEIIVNTNAYTNIHYPLARYALTSGYIAGTCGVFYLSHKILKLNGTATALTLGVLGICLNTLKEQVWEPLKKKLPQVS